MVEIIAKRYANALYEIATQDNKIDLFMDEMNFVKTVFVKETELVQVLNHPKVSTEERTKMIEDIFKGKISEEIVGLLVLILNKDRQEYIVQICDEFLLLALDYKGIVKAYVTSAVELNAAQETKLIEQLKKSLDKDVEIIKEVDESIIAGLIIRVGDKVLDNSIKTKIKKMSKDLSAIQLA